MNKDSSWAWDDIMANWQTNQSSLSKQMLENFQLWQNTFNTPQNQSNPLMGMYGQFADAFLKPYAALTPADTMNQWAEYFKGLPDAQVVTADMQALMEKGKALFESLTTDHLKSPEDEDLQTYLFKALADISNPKTWLQYSGDYFDLGIHKLSEGPFFSGITDIDQRMAQLNSSWMELFKQSKLYHAIVFDRWSQAYAKFIDQLVEYKKNQTEPVAPKTLIDLWGKIANQELLELHRTEEFLDAQKAVIRASLQYRLNEKNIAEVICEALHIPTRDEVDDLHKTVTELKRELRLVKADLKSLTESKPKKPASKPRARTPRKTTGDKS